MFCLPQQIYTVVGDGLGFLLKHSPPIINSMAADTTRHLHSSLTLQDCSQGLGGWCGQRWDGGWGEERGWVWGLADRLKLSVCVWICGEGFMCDNGKLARVKPFFCNSLYSAINSGRRFLLHEWIYLFILSDVFVWYTVIIAVWCIIVALE